jgi:DNA polymerase III subunit gamma/tau
LGYLSLYRKYRSQTFSDLIGQDHVVRTLQNGISSGRIAHAYLFTGPRGTGKTSSARLLAKALNCASGPTPEPDNTCDICRSITEGTCIDVIEMDAASEAGVENIREAIVEVVEYQPMMCRYKVFIIDEVHDLSAKAFDALLKTIEEPPAHIIFILATTEYNKVPPTIRSRCQKFEFHRASVQHLVRRLDFVAKAEGVEVEPPALTAIARMADGGYRDALTLLEQAMITSEGKITLDQVYDQLGLVSEEAVDGLLVAIREGDVPRIVDVLGEVSRRGRDPRSVLESLLYRMADLTRAVYGVDIGSQEATQEATLHETATRVGRDQLLKIRSAVADAHRVIRDISLPRLWLEAELIRIALDLQAPAVVVATAPAPKQTPAKAVTSQRVSEPPVVSPTPEPVVSQPKPEPPTEPRPVVSTGDPNKDAAVALWNQVVAALTAVSKSMGMRLADARVSDVKDHTIYIEFERQLDCSWITDVPKRQAGILEKLREIGGPDWQIEYCVSGGERRVEQPEAVELPAEGEKLVQMAREILGGQ